MATRERIRELQRTLRRPAAALLAAVAFGAAPAAAFVYTDDFSQGLDPRYWEVLIDDPLFTVATAGGDVAIAKPVGGEHGYSAVNVRFRGVLAGDFDVSVAFRNAYLDQVDGLPGNQAQLNVVFGGQEFSVVRSDEPAGGGENHHVWVNPGVGWAGAAADASTEGTMRIRRTGDLVEGFIHGNLIHSGLYGAADVTLLSLSLANNGTVDSVAVTYDDVAITAESATAALPQAWAGALDFAPPWPNPVVDATRLDFGLRRGGWARLEIFDPRGRRVLALLDGELGEGRHSLRWDGRDASGRRVASGRYYARLTLRAGDRELRRTRGLVLLR